MVLTTTEMQSYLQKYDRFIWKVVHRFDRRYGGTMTSYKEDLHQECVIALMQHAKKAENEEKLHQMPIMDMHNAMCRFVIRNQAVHYPSRTSFFSSVIRSAPDTVELIPEIVDFHRHDTTMDDYNNLIGFQSFLSTLNGTEQKVVSLKRDFSNREIARQLGVSDAAITRTLNRVRHAYEVYNNPA